MHASAPSLGWVEARRRGRVAAAVRVLTFAGHNLAHSEFHAKSIISEGSSHPKERIQRRFKVRACLWAELL